MTTSRMTTMARSLRRRSPLHIAGCMSIADTSYRMRDISEPEFADCNSKDGTGPQAHCPTLLIQPVVTVMSASLQFLLKMDGCSSLYA